MRFMILSGAIAILPSGSVSAELKELGTLKMSWVTVGEVGRRVEGEIIWVEVVLDDAKV